MGVWGPFLFRLPHMVTYHLQLRRGGLEGVCDLAMAADGGSQPGSAILLYGHYTALVFHFGGTRIAPKVGANTSYGFIGS